MATSFNSVTKEELALLLKNTSPHSFKHNVARLCKAQGVEILTDPSTDLPNLVDIATNLAITAIQGRQHAMRLGIPLEEVQEVVIGAYLNGVCHTRMRQAVHAVLFGVDDSPQAHGTEATKRRARHPYENIEDE
jgi:hypothetical protein